MKNKTIIIILLIILGVLLIYGMTLGTLSIYKINNRVHRLSNIDNSKLSEEEQIVLFLNNKYNKDFEVTQTIDADPFSSFHFYEAMCDEVNEPIQVKFHEENSNTVEITENYLSIKYKEEFASYFQNNVNEAFNNAFIQNRNLDHVPFFSNYGLLNDNTTFNEYIHNAQLDVKILLNENDFHSVKQIDKLIQSLEQEHLTYMIYLFVFYDEDFKSALENDSINISDISKYYFQIFNDGNGDTVHFSLNRYKDDSELDLSESDYDIKVLDCYNSQPTLKYHQNWRE